MERLKKKQKVADKRITKGVDFMNRLLNLYQNEGNSCIANMVKTVIGGGYTTIR